MNNKLLEDGERKLPPAAGMGRAKGVPNKSTAAVREAIAKMAELNAPRFSNWLDQVAAKSPEKACDIYLRAIEYHIPKLARTEVTGTDGQPVALQVTWAQPE
ncbi:hypothetical protein EBT25_13185 [bacterium]|jgi:hypothetical protein|nr:hypothetical protein [bacterium]